MTTQMDLDTEEGMADAIAWTNNTMSNIREGGVWGIPRSGMYVQVLTHTPKVCKLVPGFAPDPSVVRVLQACGWTIYIKEQS